MHKPPAIGAAEFVSRSVCMLPQLALQQQPGRITAPLLERDDELDGAVSCMRWPSLDAAGSNPLLVGRASLEHLIWHDNNMMLLQVALRQQPVWNAASFLEHAEKVNKPVSFAHS